MAHTLADFLEKFTNYLKTEKFLKIFASELFCWFGLSVLTFCLWILKLLCRYIFNRCHACLSSGANSCPVWEIVFHIVLHRYSSKMLSQVSRSTGLTSTDFLIWHWALLTAFRSNCIILWYRRVMQFFFITSFDFSSSCFELKVSNLSFKAFN